MFDVIKNLLMYRKLSFEEGSIMALGQPIFMGPLSMMVHLQKYLEKEGKPAIVYEISRETGIDWMKGLKKTFTMSLQEMLKWGVNTFSFAGWGKTSIVNYDQQNKRAIIHVLESSFAKAYGKSTYPVDNILRGYLAGAGCICFEDEMECVETKCISCGDKFCEFVIKKRSEIEESEITKKQVPYLFKK